MTFQNMEKLKKKLYIYIYIYIYIGLIFMLSDDYGIVTLIYVCNCQTYINNYRTYRTKAFKLI